MLVSHGFQLVTLGPHTLRSDVACVSMLAVAHEALDAAADAGRWRCRPSCRQVRSNVGRGNFSTADQAADA